MSNFDFDFNKNEDLHTIMVEKNGTANHIPEQYIVYEQNNDPNSIIVQVTEDKPTIILWGPPSSGKSISMIRLARYLVKNQYQVIPVKNFRPKDKLYEQLCDNFKSFMTNHIAPEGTGAVNFMLLQIEKDGKKICQILEAPGEHYFDPKHPTAQLPTYLATLVNKDFPKIYIFFLEVSWENELEREMYASKIAIFLGKVQSSDSVILLCNKCDKQDGYIFNGRPEKKSYEKDIRRLYPQIFNRLGKRKGILKFFLSESRDFDFVAFSSGEFKDKDGGGQVFVEGRDMYPELLWNKIIKNIKGSWL